MANPEKNTGGAPWLLVGGAAIMVGWMLHASNTAPPQVRAEPRPEVVQANSPLAHETMRGQVVPTATPTPGTSASMSAADHLAMAEQLSKSDDVRLFEEADRHIAAVPRGAPEYSTSQALARSIASRRRTIIQARMTAASNAAPTYSPQPDNAQKAALDYLLQQNAPQGVAQGAPPCEANGSCLGDISNRTSQPKTVHVREYTRKDGTVVRGHYRSK